MKLGLVASTGIHAALLAWGMVTLASPPPLKVVDVEALPVDLVPIESITQTVKGSKKAKPSNKPAPKRTKNQNLITKAVHVGDTKTDIKAEAKKAIKAPPVEKTAVPTPAPKPPPAKKPAPAPKPKVAEKPEPKPKTDIAMLTKKAQEAKPPEKTAEEAFKKLPEKVAPPKKRPEKPKPEKAEKVEKKPEKPKPEKKKPKKPEKKTAETEKKNDSKKDAKKVTSKKPSDTKTKKKSDATKKAVVNNADPNAGGAKSSKEKAGLGAKKSNNASKLSQSEIDAVRGRLEGCWSVSDLTGHPDAAKMRARVTFKLTKSGELDGRVKVKVTGTDRGTKATLAVRVRAAVTECAPYNLPADKYENWSNVVVNFSLQDML